MLKKFQLENNEEIHDILLESDEEVKERKQLKFLTLHKLLTRLPVFLALVKAENNSYKLKNEIRQIVCLLYQHYHYNNGRAHWRQQACNNNRTKSYLF